MTGPGGMTNAGYVASTADQETEYLGELVLQNVSPNLDLSPDKPLGQVLATFGAKLASLTALGASAYQAINPADASGQQLANVCAITGTLGQVPTYSTVTLDFVLNANTTVPAGTTTSVLGQPGNTWVTLEDAVNATNGQATVSVAARAQNPGAVAAAANTIQVLGTPTMGCVSTLGSAVCQLSLNDGVTVPAGARVAVAGQPNNVWVLTSSVSNSSGGPATFNGNFVALSAGPFAAAPGTITSIVSTVTGWTSVSNAAAAVAGQAAVNNPAAAVEGEAGDTDATLLQKRSEELLGQGSGDLLAIRAAVLKVGGVVSAFVYENTATTDDPASGIPAKSFRVVIWDGIGQEAANDNIAAAIWGAKPAGISPYGTTASGTAVDSAGVSRTIPFDRATQVPVYVDITVNATLTPTQINSIKQAIANFATQYWGLGVNVVWGTFFGLVYGSLAASGYTPNQAEVTSLTIGTSPSPSGTSDIAVSGLEIGVLATILINGQ